MGLRPRDIRPQLVDSLRAALAAVLVAGSAAAGLEAALLAAVPGFHPLTLAYPAAAFVYVAAGALAWWRRPGSLMGALIMLGGLALLVAGVGNTELPGFTEVGAVAGTWILAVIVHLLLAFPGGRLRHRLPRAIVAAAYVNSVVLQLPRALLPAEQGQWWAGAQSAVGTVVMVTVAGVLLYRLLLASPAKRRTLIPLYGYGLAVAGLIPTSTLILRGLLGMDPLQVWMLQMAAIAGVPLAFLAASLLGSFAPTAEAQALAAWLSAGTDRPPVAQALTRALGDPSVRITYWVPERQEFVDTAGERTDVPAPGSPDRDAVHIRSGGDLLGAILFDPRATTARAAQEAAGVVALAIEGERLTAALRASRAALLRSRSRLVEAADAVRTAIARDLHDGLQVRLVLLAVEAQRLANAAAAGADGHRLSTEATTLRHGIDEAAAELRRLARQVMPSALEERGLALAVEDLTDRMPLPTRFDAAAVPEDLPPAVALTAYFAVSEGLTNAVKHGRASTAWVTIERSGADLVVEVADDGAGGAAPRPGSGIGGLRDRVETVGGRLTVTSPQGGGTRLRVEVPCA
ncbi:MULTISPECIES: ATP-binding protein [Tessaracoccus]|uniref:ATP-binding protein n=1 Tax=Tessaracoccus TaxID=72763 RepID=UPI00099BBBF3|nr:MULTISPECIES: ATP-binding protein [Tessaracoccus]VEP40291.1 Sensor histidine kinase ComP [Tessaracoccus lapidicaptus]